MLALRFRAGSLSVVALVTALLTVSPGRAQSPARAQVGPLRAWVGRGAAGSCQLWLHNAGGEEIVAWTVTVRSEAARFVTVIRHDGWRDAFHLPLARLTLPANEARSVTVGESGAIGELTVRIHFVVLATNVAYGMSEQAAHIRPADAERRTLQDSRQRQAAEALAHAQRIDAAIAERGLAGVLASGQASALLESDGEWNWWQVSQAMKAAEALPPAGPQAAAALSGALDLLREAHRRGNAPIVLEQADTMHPVASGRCQPSDAER